MFPEGITISRANPLGIPRAYRSRSVEHFRRFALCGSPLEVYQGIPGFGAPPSGKEVGESHRPSLLNHAKDLARARVNDFDLVEALISPYGWDHINRYDKVIASGIPETDTPRRRRVFGLIGQASVADSIWRGGPLEVRPGPKPVDSGGYRDSRGRIRTLAFIRLAGLSGHSESFGHGDAVTGISECCDQENRRSSMLAGWGLATFCELNFGVFGLFCFEFRVVFFAVLKIRNASTTLEMRAPAVMSDSFREWRIVCLRAPYLRRRKLSEGTE